MVLCNLEQPSLRIAPSNRMFSGNSLGTGHLSATHRGQASRASHRTPARNRARDGSRTRIRWTVPRYVSNCCGQLLFLLAGASKPKAWNIFERTHSEANTGLPVRHLAPDRRSLSHLPRVIPARRPLCRPQAGQPGCKGERISPELGFSGISPPGAP